LAPAWCEQAVSQRRDEARDPLRGLGAERTEGGTGGTVFDTKDPQGAPTDNSVVLADLAGGYGAGLHPMRGPFPMRRIADGVWEADPQESGLQDFDNLDHRPYMFRITKNDGSVAYRGDLYSRCQIGFGGFNPAGALYRGLLSNLAGTPSCSVGKASIISSSSPA
jgi:1,4-alpha-glucan branching enzyme